jgi:hypothetical protein
MAFPNTVQGTLNRLRGSLSFTDNPALNVIASNLGPEGISVSFGGGATTRIDTLTGQVTSPEPYIPVKLTVNLLRTQALADAYKTQQELNSLLGDVTFRTDAVTLGVYQFSNSSIGRVADMRVNGKDAGYALEIEGTYNINSSLYG